MTLRPTEEELAEMLARNPQLKVHGQLFDKFDKLKIQLSGNSEQLKAQPSARAVVSTSETSKSMAVTPLTGMEHRVKPQKPVIKGESEAEFATWFEDILHRFGYKFAHFRPARVMRHGKEIYETPVSGDAAGLEDYFIWHEIKRVHFWAELKSATGELSDKQQAIIASHKAAGIIVFVFRPSDRDVIENIAKGLVVVV